MVIVCSGINVETYNNRSAFAWLREEYNRGVAVGGLCTGAHVLAAAGLLSNKRCAIHWENLPGFSEAFPKANVFADLFEVDQNIYTCAGGTAALDMMLKLIGDDFDENLVNRVCEQVLTDRVRSPTDRQRLPLRARLGVQNSKVLTIIELMEANLSEPLSLIEIADHVGLSRRQIERLFRTGDGPLAGPLLSGDPARPRPAPADPVVDAGGRGGGRLRLRLGLAFLEMLPRALCALAAAGARRPQATAGGVSCPCLSPSRGEADRLTACPTSSCGRATSSRRSGSRSPGRPATLTTGGCAASRSHAATRPASSSTSLRRIASGNCDQSLTGIMKAPGPPITQSV